MKRLMMTSAMAIGLSTSASAATLVNGSFEDPIIADNWGTFYAGSTDITGWTVGGEGVDLIDFYWEASDQSQSLDMSAGGAGSVSQTITDLIIGQRYRVTFDMSANPAGGERLRDLSVNVGALTRQYTYEMDRYMPTRTDMAWVERSFFFTAVATEETITFASLENTPYGAGLDNVQIAAVPVPASAAMLGLGLMGLGAYRARRKS